MKRISLFFYLFIFQGCASLQYQLAMENLKTPWGLCSGSSEIGFKDKIKIFKLSKEIKNEGKQHWLEGHSHFIDGDGGESAKSC